MINFIKGITPQARRGGVPPGKEQRKALISSLRDISTVSLAHCCLITYTGGPVPDSEFVNVTEAYNEMIEELKRLPLPPINS